MIRTLAVIGCAALIGACCNAGDEPAAPYPNPDDTIRSKGTNGYATVTYLYHCRNDRFVSVTYSRQDDCSDYEKSGEFTSECTPPLDPLRAVLAGLTAEEQARVLRAAGREVRVIYQWADDRGVVEP